MTHAKTLLFAALSFLAATAQTLAAMPKPILRVVSATESAVWIRYELSVDNRNDFDPALFQPTPDFLSCAGPGYSAAMVYVYDIANPGTAIHVFCPANRDGLGSIRYALKKSVFQSGHVMIRIYDKLTNQSVWSNIAIANLPPRVTGVDAGHPPPAETLARVAQIRTGAGLCLDVREAEMTTNGGRVEAWACNGRPHQSWSYDRTSRAVRVANGHCLDVHGGIQQNGNHVQVWSCNGQWQQQWTPLANGALQNAGGFCLDVHAEDQTRNGARVQIWQCNGSQQQRFTSSVF